MSIQFIWTDDYAVGNPALDEQHQRMFALANSLSEILSVEQIKKSIWHMFKHLNDHFSDEEKMMKEIDYPKLSEHRELHNELITKLSDISSYSFDSDESIFKFKKFIYDWLVEHIMIADKDYFRFLQNKSS